MNNFCTAPKLLCIVMALMLCACALCEGDAPDPSVIENFSNTWVDDNAAVEIWFEDGAFHCSASQTEDGGETAMVWTYAACRYDPETFSLVCEGGTRAYEYVDEATGELASEVVVENLTDSFEFDDWGHLIWNDQEGICKRYQLIPLDHAEALANEEAQAFAGRWGAGRCTIDVITQPDGTFHVHIAWANSAAEETQWDYGCAYDDARKRLVTYVPGVKATVTYAENGETSDWRSEYKDGDATFAIDDADMLIWNDLKEDAGKDMRFERGILPEDLN